MKISLKLTLILHSKMDELLWEWCVEIEEGK